MNVLFKARFLCAALLSVSFSFGSLFAQSAQAQSNIQSHACQSWFRMVQTRDGGPLNLRDYPNGPIIGIVSNSSEVLFNTGDRTGEWSEITLQGGRTGWVADRYLSRHAADAAQYSGQWKIKTLDGDSVALRAEAGTGSKALDALKPGQIVNEIENVGYWTEVRTLKGSRGFVSNQFLVCR